MPSTASSSTRCAFPLPPTASTRCSHVSAIIAVGRRADTAWTSMPSREAWSTWLFLGDAVSPTDGRDSATYWLDASVAANPLLSALSPVPTGQHHRAGRRGTRRGFKSRPEEFPRSFFPRPGVARRPGLSRPCRRYCAWAKPMTYRVAKGPAGLRLEIPALVEGIARMFGLSEASISAGHRGMCRALTPTRSMQTREFRRAPCPS